MNRRTRLSRITPLRSTAPLQSRTPLEARSGQGKDAATRRTGLRPALTGRQRKDTIPPKVRRQVHDRDERWCQHCGCHFPEGGIHQHHRRLKQDGGDPRPCTNCPCNLVSLCWTCHDWLHNTGEGRVKAEAEGFIIPNAAREPGRYPVLRHGTDDCGGAQQWPTCGGQWADGEPEGRAA